MILTVVKRDGRVVGFNEEKIQAAIRKAMIHTEKGEDEQLVARISTRVAARGKEQMGVEEIQDQVERELMKSSRKDVAREYISYRNKRSVARKAKTRDIFMSIVNAKKNDITRENANMNADTPAGMMMKFASETPSRSWTTTCSLRMRVWLWSTTISTSTTRTIIPPSRSPVCSIRSTSSCATDSRQVTDLPVRPSASRRQPYWLASPWRLVRTRCTEVRPFRLSTSISLPMCAIPTRRK